MANTGYQRSLTLIITKTVNGVAATGYPKTYNGRNGFSHNGNTYPAITGTQLAQMTAEDYEQRLADFKGYVQGLEYGLDVDAVTVPGSEAYRENLDACPLP